MNLPVMDIFIRTYSEDLKWLTYSLQSINKFCTGFRNIIIVIPEKQKNLLNSFNLTREKIFTCPDYKDDYLGQQITKLHADEYSDADLFLYGDSDTLITKKLKPEYLFREEKPLILKTKYQSLGKSVPWKKITEKALGFEIEYEFMRRHPLVYYSSTLKALRNYIKQVHQKEISDYIQRQSNKSFSEFNTLGAYANKFENDRYYFQDTETEELPTLYVRQFWSWGGITDEVKNEIQDILK